MAQRLIAVDIQIRIGGGEFRRHVDDAPHDRMDGIRRGFIERLYRGQPLCDRCAAIERKGDFAERGIVEFHQLPAEFYCLCQCGVVEFFRRCIACEITVGGAQNPGAGFRRQSNGCGCARIGIASVKTFGGLQNGQRIRGTIRKDRDAVEAFAGRHRAGRRDAADRGFQADEVVERSGHTARARRIRAE